MLDNETKEQLKQYLALLESKIVFSASLDESEESKKVEDFLTEVAAMDDKILIETKNLKRTPSF